MSTLHPVKIKDREIKGNLFLAPMAGYTDSAFRSLCTDWGADLCYTEMISAEGLIRDSAKTFRMMERAENEKQYAIQLFLSSPDPVERSLEQIHRLNPSLIDINCGCPVPKVTSNGSGSALMKEPDTAYRIVRKLVENSDIPITVKFRLGWDNNHQNFIEFADSVCSAGASALGLHTRTRTQGYAPFAHPEKLDELAGFLSASHPSVKLVASGDIFTAQDAVDVLRMHKCDAVMVARGAIGNPFIFTQAKRIASGQEELEITMEMRAEALITHLKRMIELYGEDSACRQMRKHAAGYLKGIRGAAKWKASFVRCSDLNDYQRCCDLLTSTL